MILQCHKIWTQVCLYSNGQRWFQVWLIGLNVLWQNGMSSKIIIHGHPLTPDHSSNFYPLRCQISQPFSVAKANDGNGNISDYWTPRLSRMQMILCHSQLPNHSLPHHSDDCSTVRTQNTPLSDSMSTLTYWLIPGGSPANPWRNPVISLEESRHFPGGNRDPLNLKLQIRDTSNHLYHMPHTSSFSH